MSVATPGAVFNLVNTIKDRVQNVKVYRVRLGSWPFHSSTSFNRTTCLLLECAEEM